jgi:hypothetical protein
MLKVPVTPMKAPLADHHAPKGAHRNGSGHLNPIYEAELRARVQGELQRSNNRAFLNGMWSDDASVEESGDEFVMTVTSGEDGGESTLDDETSEERGGPFIETDASVEFAYDADESNPIGATREPFPTS